MDPHNLAIIFSPTLLQGPNSDNPDQLLKMMPKQTMLVLIDCMSVCLSLVFMSVCLFVCLSTYLTNHVFLFNRVIELIIKEQLMKLTATLRGIHNLTSVARNTAYRISFLTSEENKVCTYIYHQLP